jgi:hypothetical protein
MRPPVDEHRLRELARDLDDVQKMIGDGLVEPQRLRELFEAIEPQLYRYPAIDPAVFRRKVETATGSPHS